MVLAQGSKIQILNANVFEPEEKDGVRVKKLIGDVRLRQDNTLLSCDSAYLFEETNYVEAYRNVRINHNDSVDFYGDILKYEGSKKLATLEQNVRMTDRNATLTCNELEFDMARNKASYYNGGRLVSGESVLTSKSGYYYTSSRELFFKRDVRLESPDFRLTSDTLKYQTNTRIATFFANTQIVSDEDTIYCNAGNYHTVKQTGLLRGRARIRSKENTLIADTIIYDRKNKYSKALGNIYIIDTVNKTTVLGQVAELFGKERRSYVTNKALVISLMDDDTLTIQADTIYTLQQSNQLKSDQLRAYAKVRIYRDDLQAVCDSLVYTKNDSSMVLYRQPILWSDANQITGDTIVFFLNNRKLDSMYVLNNSFVISKETARHYNQIKGRNMKADFVKGKVSLISVYGNGQSIYYAKEDSAYIGVNVIDCSEMRFLFKEGKVDKAQFLTQPEATFQPIDKMKPEELRLRGFVWHQKRRPSKQNLKSTKM